ncbi:SMI1/KNR4 family protein [Bacillus sp. Cs-700]|uniref:SMI1/KNR4 family protein n=1 Tax=Bacillus sp. Cs-700 TaxID=2589818 RepID=UPI001407AD02|nr:SMI1/KNR4 family protein [Bacillus sp. Cs-700]
MNGEELERFIHRYMEADDFTGGVDERQITYVQDKLDRKLPKSYQWFLKNYGSGGVFGVDIVGIAKNNIASVIRETKRYQTLGMGKNLVVVEDQDEYAYCLDTSIMENGECPVIAWNRSGGLDDYYTASNFYEFLSERLMQAKEAWDEPF